MATTAPRTATPARMPSTTAIRRTERRASRPRRDSPVATMTAAISAGHEGRQAEPPRRLPAQQGVDRQRRPTAPARPAGSAAARRSRRRSRTRRRRRSPTAATRRRPWRSRRRRPAPTTGSTRPPTRRSRRSTAVSTTSAGRHAVGWAPADGPADGRGDGDHGDDDRVALGDPVAADPLRRPRAASRRRHRPPSWWTTTVPPLRPAPTRRRPPARRPTAPAGRRPSTRPRASSKRSGGTGTWLISGWFGPHVDLSGAEEHLVQLLARAQPGVDDRHRRRRLLGQAGGDLGDAHRLAHVEHEHLAGPADGAGLDRQRDRPPPTS